MIRFGYVQSGVQRFAEWTEESGLVCEDDLRYEVGVLVSAGVLVRCAWVGYLMEASLDDPVRVWGTINTALKRCERVELVRCTPPLIQYDEFSDPDEDLVEKAMTRSEAGKYAAEQRWKNHVRATDAKQEILLPTDDVKVARLTGRPISWLLPATRDPELTAILAKVPSWFPVLRSVDYKSYDRIVQDPNVKELLDYLEAKGITGLTNYQTTENFRMEETNAGIVAVGLVMQALQQDNFQQWIPSFEWRVNSQVRKARGIAEEGSPIVNVPEYVLDYMLRDGYKTQFETGDSGGMLSNSVRASFESAVLGLHPDMDPTKRPVYGTMQTFQSMTKNTVPDQYGSISIQLKENVRDRTTVSYNDSLGMAMSTANSNDKNLDRMFNTGEIRSGLEYVEAQIHGGVSVDDIKAIWLLRGSSAQQIKVVRDTLDEFGHANIPVLVVGVDEFYKATFSSRSEAGKYAAHIRWMNQRGQTPMTVDQWKGRDTGGSERMRKIKELQADVAERLRKFNILLGKSHVLQDGIWDGDAEREIGYDQSNKVSLIKIEDWEETSIPKSGLPAELWAVEVQTDLNGVSGMVAVPNAEVMRLMEDVKTLGGLIEEEALERANASSSPVVAPVTSTLDFSMKIIGLQAETKNNEWLMHNGMTSLVNFRWDPDGEGTKFEQWVASGIPSQLSGARAGMTELGEVGKKTVQSVITKFNVRSFDEFVDVMQNEILSSQTAIDEAGFDQNSLAKYRREVLREIRPYSTDDGMHNEIITGDPTYSGTALESHVGKAMRLLPAAWVEKLKNYTKQHDAQGKMGVQPATEARSGYSEPHHFIQTSTDAQPMTLVHELIHAVEASNPAMRVMVNAFHINRRFGNFKADDEKSGSTFSKRLAGKYEMQSPFGRVEDSYADTYSGRVYPSFELVAREQLTTGTDMSLFVNSMRQHGQIDSDQLNFTLGMWASA